MDERRGTKRTYISISSSSSEDDLIEEESESEEYCGNGDDNYDEMKENSTSTSCDDDNESGSEWSDDKGDESDDQEDEEPSDLDNDESRCNSVIRLLQEKSDLQGLNLKDCKSYLRQNGLRITGTKAECIQRIMEHWRIKDGNAEALYPRSSFAINCTGDVCKGDVVLFTQRVYKKFDKMTRRGNFLGKRTIAGRIVKESYGAAKQQHTFTIEVLWSKGIKKLHPLFPLLVKGRNLYKLKTYRQRWMSERERLKVLAEKHKRGAAARLVRATKKACSKNGGVKRQKHFHHARPSQPGKKAEPEKVKHGYGCGKASREHLKSNNHHQKAVAIGTADSKKNLRSRALKSSRKHQNLTYANKNGYPTTQSYTCPPQNFHQSQNQFHHHHQWRAPSHFPCYEAGSTSSTMRFPLFRPYMDSSVLPISQHHGFYPHHTYSYPSHVFENPLPPSLNVYGLSKPSSLGKQTNGQRRRGF